MIGVPSQDLFMTVDLYEGKNMDAIVRNLHSLGRVAQTISKFEGPHLGVSRDAWPPSPLPIPIAALASLDAPSPPSVP